MSQKAVEAKQFVIPNNTVYLHVAKRYAKFGAGRLAIGAVLGEGVQKIIDGVVSCFLSRLWGLNMHTY